MPSSPTGPSYGCYYNAKKVKIEASTEKNIQVFEVQVFSGGVNVAVGKSAVQSSTFTSAKGKKFSAHNAIDGNFDSFSHTDDINSWLEVDLEDTFSIESIEIFNRWCRDSSDPMDCFCRLSDATVSILDNSGSVIAETVTNNTCRQPILNITFPAPCQAPTKSPAPSIYECHPKVQKIKIESTTGQNINMFGFHAFSKGIDIASSGTASQSSTLFGRYSFDASLALDGDTTTFSHTDDANAFWEVDLGVSYSIESVTIENRWCRKPNDPKQCLCRLSNATLVLIDESGLSVSTVPMGDTCNTKTLEYEFEKSPYFCSVESPERRLVSPSTLSSSARSRWHRELGKRPRCS
jgi:hypothetical protein